MIRNPNFCLVGTNKDGTKVELLWFDAATKASYDTEMRFTRGYTSPNPANRGPFPKAPPGATTAESLMGRALVSAIQFLDAYGIKCEIVEYAAAA